MATDTPPDRPNDPARNIGFGKVDFLLNVLMVCTLCLVSVCLGMGLQKDVIGKFEQASSGRYSLHLWTSQVTLQQVERVEERVFRTEQGRLLYVGNDETFTLTESK